MPPAWREGLLGSQEQQALGEASTSCFVLPRGSPAHRSDGAQGAHVITFRQLLRAVPRSGIVSGWGSCGQSVEEYRYVPHPRDS